MKHNWLTYVSIVAALMAGMVCSTAFAEGKNGGNKFSGGNFRISGGGNGGGGGPSKQFQQLNRNGIKSLGQSGGGSGMQSQGFPKVIKQVQGGQGMSGIRTMPGKFPGNVNNGNKNGGLGIGLGGQNGKPKITINPGLGQSIGGAVLGGGKKPQIHVQPGIGQSIGGAVLGNKHKIDPGFSVGKSLGNAVLGKHCIPGCNPKPCDPCHNHNNKWCGPTWWWSPCWEPSYKSCYYPTTVYAYPQTLVIPVQTVVVGSPAPVVAEQLMQIPVGATVTLQGTDLGDHLGMLVVQIDKVSLPAQVNEWRPDAVNVTLPMLGLAGPTQAQLWMVKADGSVAANIAVELLPAQQPAAAAVVDQNSAAAALGGIE